MGIRKKGGRGRKEKKIYKKKTNKQTNKKREEGKEKEIVGGKIEREKERAGWKIRARGWKLREEKSLIKR
jgi:hypothetical protein